MPLTATAVGKGLKEGKKTKERERWVNTYETFSGPHFKKIKVL